MAAVFPGAVATNADLIVAGNNDSSTLAVNLTAVDTTLVFVSSGIFQTSQAVVIGSEIILLGTVAGAIATGCTRGYAGTTAATHSVGETAQDLIIASHHNNLKDEVIAVEAALGVNLRNIAPTYRAASFNWSGVPLSIALTGGVSSTVTLSPFPAGINALSANKHYIRIVDTVGVSEAVLITAVNVVAGTVSFTPAGSHATANSTLSSATSGIQEAICFASNATLSWEVLLADAVVPVYQKIFVRVTSVRSGIIRGAANNWSLLERHSSYPAGDLLFVDGAVGSNSSTKFIDFRISNANGFNNTSGYAFSCVNASEIFFEDLTVYDGSGGYNFTTSNYVRMSGCRYFESAAQALAGYASAVAGIRFSGAINNVLIVNSMFESQYNGLLSSMLTYGILIEGCDGIQFSNCASNGKIGIGLVAAASSIDDLHFVNHISDSCQVRAVYITGNVAPGLVYTNIHFTNIHCNTKPQSTAQSVIGIDGNCDYVDFTAMNVNLGWESAVRIIPTTAYHGGAQQHLLFNGCEFSGNNISDVINVSMIALAAGVTGVKINNCTTSRRPGLIKQIAYGVGFTGGSDNCSLTGNTFRDSTDGPIYLAGGVHTNFVLSNNVGIDNITPSVASAATLACPPYPNFKITGAVGIGAITGMWAGRRGQIVTTSGAVTFTASASIANTVTTTINKPINYFFDGTLLYLG